MTGNLSFFGEKQRLRFRWVTLASTLFFLAGCASDAAQSRQPVREESVVVGSGSSDDRNVINSTGQQMFNIEHGGSPDSSVRPDSNLP